MHAKWENKYAWELSGVNGVTNQEVYPRTLDFINR